MNHLARVAAAALASAAILISTLGGRPALALPPVPVAPVPEASTPPPLTATATPAPSGQVVKYSGELLDVRKGFAVFTTGDAFRLDPQAKVDDAKTGGATALSAQTGVFARASFDTGSGAIVELALSSTPLPAEASYDEIKKFVVVATAPTANPDLAPRAGYNGKPVNVVFLVNVPPKTPIGDTVYLSTDASGWSATAIKMDRIGADQYRVSRVFASGTALLYRYTRGSTQSAERTVDGQERTRSLVVHNGDTDNLNDTVANWADQNENQPDNGAIPGSIPTPFNPIPFVTPPGRPPH